MERGATQVGGWQARPDRARTRVPIDRAAHRRFGDAARRYLRLAAGAARHRFWRFGNSASARALRDMDRQEAEQSLYRRVFAEAPVAVVLLDEELRIVEFNEELARMFGARASELPGSPVSALASAPYPARLGLMAQKAASGAGTVVVEHRYPRGDGSEGWVRTSMRQFQTGDHRVAMVCTLEDFTNDQIALEQQRKDAEHDPLTGVLNRRGGDRRLRSALAKMAESGPVAVILCDADRFKEVNDRYGHAAGDELLSGMAGRLRAAVRAGDEVARLGGDEFIVVARVANEHEAVAIAERCVLTASGPFRLQTSDSGPEQVTLSAGVAVAYPGGPVEPRSLLAAADRALYAAKAQGGGRWMLADGP